MAEQGPDSKILAASPLKENSEELSSYDPSQAVAASCLLAVPVGFALTLQDVNTGFWIWFAFVAAVGLILGSNISRTFKRAALPAATLGLTMVLKIAFVTIVSMQDAYKRADPQIGSLPQSVETLYGGIFVGIIAAFVALVSVVAIGISATSANVLLRGWNSATTYPSESIDNVTNVLKALAGLAAAALALWAIFF